MNTLLFRSKKKIQWHAQVLKLLKASTDTGFLSYRNKKYVWITTKLQKDVHLFYMKSWNLSKLKRKLIYWEIFCHFFTQWTEPFWLSVFFSIHLVLSWKGSTPKGKNLPTWEFEWSPIVWRCKKKFCQSCLPCKPITSSFKLVCIQHISHITKYTQTSL